MQEPPSPCSGAMLPRLAVPRNIDPPPVEITLPLGSGGEGGRGVLVGAGGEVGGGAATGVAGLGAIGLAVAGALVGMAGASAAAAVGRSVDGDVPVGVSAIAV